MKPYKTSSFRDIHQIPVYWNYIINILVGSFAFLCVFPFIFVLILSLTDENSILIHGYQLIPVKWSVYAYSYIFHTGEQLFRSYKVTVFITVVGTFLTVTCTILYSYAISRNSFTYRRFFTFISFFTMLFGGGLVPSYIVVTQLLHLKDTVWALILPMMMNAFYILILRTFFKTMVPDAIIESGKMDGAGEFRVLFFLVLPISLPGIATIALFSTLGYWNDWFNALLYIESDSLVPLQALLMRIENNMQFIIQNSALLNSGQGKQLLISLPQDTSRMAMVVLVTGPIVLAYPFFQRYFVQGLTIGAVKE